MKIGTQNKDHKICIQGKFSQNRNQQSNRRLETSIFEMVHTDFTDPIDPVNINGHRYTITFTDDFFNTLFLYFLKSKINTVSANKKCIADTTR